MKHAKHRKPEQKKLIRAAFPKSSDRKNIRMLLRMLTRSMQRGSSGSLFLYQWNEK